ncbi:MAG: lipoprotein-releasing ABC transporter permease subunit [Cocleimonas sp.]
MFKPIELFVGLRYTRSKNKNNNFISFISLASMLGIIFGVLVLITVLSVMNGFEKEFRDRILSMVSHVTVSGTDGHLSDWRDTQTKLIDNPSIKGSAPFIQEQVMLSANGQMKGVLIQGIQPEQQSAVVDMDKHMIEGNFSDLKPRGYSIALGVELAESLGVFPGDKVTVITPQIMVTPAGMMPRSKRFTVTSLYRIKMPEYDSSTAFMHMRDASKLFRTKDKVTGIRLKMDDLFKAPILTQQLTKKLGNRYSVKDWGEANKTLFQVMKTERIVMFFILFLIILVAVFNLVSTLVMVVNDKQSDIAILRTQGMSANQIRKIFMVQGTIIGFVGALVGAILGVLLAMNVGAIMSGLENVFSIQIMPQDVFYDSTLPSLIKIPQVIGIALVAFILAILATFYPASRASKIQPADSLRYD